MSDLRAAREQAGLSLADASQRTRIPERYLAALESGDLSVFPPGPFLSGYTRQYRAFLKLPERATEPVVVAPVKREKRERRSASGTPAPAPETTVTEPASPSRRARRRGIRAVAAGGLACVTLLLGVEVAGELFPGGDPEVGSAPDQKVAVTVVERVRARVETDGRSVLEGALVPGAARTFEAHDRLVLDLQTLDGVSIVYNGRALTPLGTKGVPRRLVFIDDAGR